MPDPPIPDDGITDEGERTYIDPLSGIPLPPQTEEEEEAIGDAVERNMQQAEEDLGLRDPVSDAQGATHAAAAGMRIRNYEQDLPIEVLEQATSTGKSQAAAFAAATVLVAAVGVGVWTANNGGDDSTGASVTTVESESASTEATDETTAGAAVADPESQPVLGERWLIYAKFSQGYRDYHNFDTYFAASLVFADGQDFDTQHPRYMVESGQVLFTDVDQPDGPTGCTYTGAASFNAVDPSLIHSEGKAGYLEFDLTTTPGEYWAQIIVRGLTRPLTHTCPETESITEYGDSMVFVDTYRSEGGFLKSDANGNYVLFDGYVGGTAGYVDSVWIIFPCQPDLCDSSLDVLGDEKMAGIIDQTITDAILEGL